MQHHWKLVLPGTIVALAILASPFASAQSSGNFASAITTTQCEMNTVGGSPNAGGLSAGSPHQVLDTTPQPRPPRRASSMIKGFNN